MTNAPTGRILIVDDDPVILGLTGRLLAGAGHQVLTAQSGKDGLQLARTAAPDLVLLDVLLPDILGLEVCRRIKAATDGSAPHVLLISGTRTATDEQAQGLEEGADGYVVRPVANRELLARVESMLRLRQMEERLRQQERLAAVGQLTSGLAHNLNSLLQGMLLRTELMAQDQELTARARRSMEQLRVETEKGASLVQQMLDFSRRTVLLPAALALATVVQDAVDTAAQELAPGISLDVTIETTDAVVWGDEPRLKQLLLNLIQNGMDAMSSGGQLSIRLQSGAVARRCNVCHQPISGDWLQLMVRDEGAGMSKKVASRAFEPFFSTRVPQRRGLGLSQVLGIVKQHGGHITLDSKVDKGTTVTVYLQAYTG